MRFVKETDKKFDVVLVDSTDPLGPAKALYSEDFYKNVFHILNDGGLLVVQAQSPFFDPDVQKLILQSLKTSFPMTFLYNYVNISYSGGFWSFAMASKKYHPLKDFDADKVKPGPFSYYDRGIHCASFSQPQFVKNTLGPLLSD